MKRLLLGTTLLLTLVGGALAAAKPEQIPADAKGVMLIQMKALMNSPFMKAAEAKLPPGTLTDSATLPFSSKDVKEITAFGSEKWVAALFEVPYKSDEVIKKATEAGSQKKTVSGKTVLIDSVGDKALVLLAPGEILFIGAEDLEKSIAGLLNPKTPRLAAASPLAAVLKTKPGQHLYGAVTDVNKILASNPEAQAQTAMTPGIENVRRAVITLQDADKDGLRLMLKLVADTAEHGAQLQESLLGMKAMMGMAVAQMPALNPLLKSFTVKQTGPATDAAITLRVSDIEAIMGLFLMGETTTVTQEKFTFPQ